MRAQIAARLMPSGLQPFQIAAGVLAAGQNHQIGRRNRLPGADELQIDVGMRAQGGNDFGVRIHVKLTADRKPRCPPGNKLAGETLDCKTRLDRPGSGGAPAAGSMAAAPSPQFLPPLPFPWLDLP